jgi:hypothetical protein
MRARWLQRAIRTAQQGLGLRTVGVSAALSVCG